MFQETCTALQQTIMPIVVAWRVERGKVYCGIGAGMILNEEGWFITAGHILKQIADLDKQVTVPKQTRKKGNRPTAYVAIFGTTNAHLEKGTVKGEIDLGIGKLEGYSPPNGHVFPKLRIRDVQQGELLCRAGYPFVDDIKPSWKDKDGGGFTFTNLFPVPLFVNEALVSRFAKLNSGMWIETSSPGLKGQSGGPLADADGLICGIQVNTHHYPLGFQGGGRNQVLNVGRAVHVETIRNYLDSHSINYFSEGGPRND